MVTRETIADTTTTVRLGPGGPGSSVTSTASVSSSTSVSRTITSSSVSTSSQDQSSSSTATGGSSTTRLIESLSSASIDLASQTSQALPSDTTNPKSGLPTGAKDGIGVGAALGSLIILRFVAFAFWFGRRSAKNKREATGDDVMVGKSELQAGTVRASELDTKFPDLAEKVNMHDEARAAEFDGKPAGVAEVDGTHRVELDSGAKKSR
ncbi:hypothetical protein DL95DRAFT_462888 [Leptodontidium sp. 2 PMI_412]|nr:hypothetical protein DL95DRAFT_462888 [Leptodontidium sp. 2 PMI_412]